MISIVFLILALLVSPSATSKKNKHRESFQDDISDDLSTQLFVRFKAKMRIARKRIDGLAHNSSLIQGLIKSRPTYQQHKILVNNINVFYQTRSKLFDIEDSIPNDTRLNDLHKGALTSVIKALNRHLKNLRKAMSSPFTGTEKRKMKKQALASIQNGTTFLDEDNEEVQTEEGKKILQKVEGKLAKIKLKMKNLMKDFKETKEAVKEDNDTITEDEEADLKDFAKAAYKIKKKLKKLYKNLFTNFDIGDIKREKQKNKTEDLFNKILELKQQVSEMLKKNVKKQQQSTQIDSISNKKKNHLLRQGMNQVVTAVPSVQNNSVLQPKQMAKP